MLGNLGSDGSGTVTEFVLEAPPFVGFVKRECSGAGARSADPSVNHLVVVDSSGGLPRHSCDYEQDSACTGASSDLDDDIVHDIAPGSPILYLLYSSESGYCIKQDEHRAIFDAAVRCLWADDPFAAVRGDQEQVDTQALVEVDVDERGEIVFGGTAAYIGWAKGGGPSIVSGPGGSETALLFEEGRWLQLGDDDEIEFVETYEYVGCFVDNTQGVRDFSSTGASARSNSLTADGLDNRMHQCSKNCAAYNYFGLQWFNQCYCDNTYGSQGIAPSCTRCGMPDGNGCGGRNAVYKQARTLLSLDCMINVDMQVVELAEMATLLSSADGATTIGWEIMQALHEVTDGWHQVTLHVNTTHGSGEAAGRETRTVFVDGVETANISTAYHDTCGDAPCAYNFLSVGSQPGGSSPFPLRVWRLRLFKGLIAPDLQQDHFIPLPFHSANSRWVEISRGLDGVDITWDTIGWEQATHEQVKVTLDPAGGITVTARNMSVLWDRAVASAGGVTGDSAATANWTSRSLNTSGPVGLRVSYVDSDPCFDLWRGIDCSPSDWPVGTDECGESDLLALSLFCLSILSNTR